MTDFTRLTPYAGFKRIDSVVSSDGGVDSVHRARSQYPVTATAHGAANAQSLYTEGRP